jgi:hypothetical protein
MSPEPSYLDVDGKLIETGMGNALVGHYLSQLGMGQKTVMFATAAPPDNILWLDAETSSLSAIEYDTIPGEPTSNAHVETVKLAVPSEPPKVTINPAYPQPAHGSESETTPSTFKQWMAKTSETIRNVETFAEGLRQKGYKADIDRTDPNSPRVLTGIDGNKIAISFSSCFNMNCNYAEIMSYWNEVDEKRSKLVISAWNNEENFSSVIWFPTSKNVAVYHYIIIGSDGITLQNLIENLEYFSRDYTKIGTRLSGSD